MTIDQDFVYQDEVQLDTLEETMTYEAQELLPSVFQRDGQEGPQIKMKGIMQFILARRPRQNQGEWEFFGKEKLNKIVTSVQVA